MNYERDLQEIQQLHEETHRKLQDFIRSATKTSAAIANAWGAAGYKPFPGFMGGKADDILNKQLSEVYFQLGGRQDFVEEQLVTEALSPKGQDVCFRALRWMGRCATDMMQDKDGDWSRDSYQPQAFHGGPLDGQLNVMPRNTAFADFQIRDATHRYGWKDEKTVHYIGTVDSTGATA